MKISIDIQITDESLKKAGLNNRQILDASLEVLSDLFDKYDLDFDCGYNPQLITNGIRN